MLGCHTHLTRSAGQQDPGSVTVPHLLTGIGVFADEPLYQTSLANLQWLLILANAPVIDY